MQSQEIAELAKALCSAQAGMSMAKVDATNPHFKNKYATLSSVLETIRKPLADNGLAISQMVICNPDGTRVLRTMLIHVSGQWLMGEYPLPSTATPQQMGSALTYARRYSLSAIICNAVDDDDDANTAETVKPAPQPAPRRAAPKAAAKSEGQTEAKPEAKPNGPMNMQQIVQFEQHARNAAKRGSLSLGQFWRNLTTQQERAIVEGLRTELIGLRDEADAKIAEADANPQTGEF